MTDRATVEAGVQAALRLIEEREPTLAALVDEDDRAARIESAVAEIFERFPYRAERPPLFGALVGVKDIFHVDGLPTRGGSALPPETLAGPEASSVRRLREAGAIVLGKTVTTEFAYFAPGPTRNPHNPEHTPGGSSSGSAAAVAAGYCPLALGTQTIGSVNRPAAFCGVLGFKPTHERIARDGVIPLSTSLDHVGLFARELRPLRAAASLLLDGSRGSDTVARPILGFPTGAYLARASDEAIAHFEECAKRLADAGYEVCLAEPFDRLEEIEARHALLVARDAATTHGPWFEEHAERYHPKTRELVERGLAVDSEAHAAAIAGRDALRQALEERMIEHEIDLWITPSAPGAAPHGLESTGDPVMNLPWTQAGHPTLTLPSGKSTGGLPLGLQVVGRWGHDEELLAHAGRLAAALQPAG